MHSAGARPQVSGVARWAEDAFRSLSDVGGVRRVGLALVEGGGRRLRFTSSDRTADPELDWCHIDGYDDVPLNTAVRTGEPVLGSLDHLHHQFGGYVDGQRDTETVALAAVPVVAGGQTLGGYLLLYDRPQQFDRRQRLQLARTGRELGAALRRARTADRSRPQVPLADDPLPVGARMATHDVDGDPAAVAGARGFLRQTLEEWRVDRELVDNAILCLSELVTNAVIHSHSGCVVRAVLARGVLTVTIMYWGGDHAASVAEVTDPLQVHGRGLQVVEALATRWGHERDTEGASVWFSIELGPADDADDRRAEGGRSS